MPANLPPQYGKADAADRRAAAPADRREALGERPRLLNRPEGTEPLPAERTPTIRRAKAKRVDPRAASRGGATHRVPRQGAGPVVLDGAPNAGRSGLLTARSDQAPLVVDLADDGAADAEGAGGGRAALREGFADSVPVVASSRTGAGVDVVGAAAYDLLRMMRISTKVPGRSADRSAPWAVPLGSTVLDRARSVHRDLERTLRSARARGSRGASAGPAAGRGPGRPGSDPFERRA